MAEEQSKHIEELVEQLRRVEDEGIGVGIAPMGSTASVVAGLQTVVKALRIHGQLVALLTKSSEKLLRASEKLERWTAASVFLAFTLVFLTFALLFIGGLQALGPDVRQTLPNWAGKAWAVFLGVAFVAFAVAVVFAVIYFAKAQKALVPPKRKG